MKKILGTGVALALLTGSALAADLPIYKAKKADPLWDVAVGGYVASDYNFRGVSQSNRHASGGAYFELQYNNFIGGQLYVGTAMMAVDLQTGTEVDFYAGWRKTWGNLALDLGYIYYYYPKEKATYGNAAANDTDFQEVYVKAAYTVTPALTLGLSLFYSPDVLHLSSLNGGVDRIEGLYTEVSAKYVLAWTSPTAYGPLGAYVSGAYGYWDLATDRTGVVFAGTDVSYSYWNAGIAFTLSALTLDLRYHDTDLTAAQCATFTGFQTPTAGSGVNNWCNSTFVAKLSFDTLLSKIKN
jgi:uncharacterized protein (TIGR02001 family)